MRRLLPLFATLTLVLAGCGGYGDDDDASDAAGGAAASEADAASDEESEDSEDADSADDADGDSFSGSGSGDFCDKAREYDKKFENIGQNSEDAEKEWNELEKAIDDISRDAPQEIEDDVALVARNFKEVKALYEKYDYDFSKVPEDEAAAIDMEGVEEANERVNSYMETVCEIDQDGDGDTDGVKPGSDPAAEE